jgi:hypothetical protein
MARALEVEFPPKNQAKNAYDLETTSEIFRNLFSDDEKGSGSNSRGEKNHGDQARSIAKRSPCRSLCNRIRSRVEDNTTNEL